VAAFAIGVVVLLAFSASLGATEFGQLSILLSLAKIVFLLCEPRIHEYLIPRLVTALTRRRDGMWVWTRIGVNVELTANLLASLVCLAIYAFFPSVLAAQSGGSDLFPAAMLFVLTSTLLKFSAIAIFRSIGEVRTSALMAVAGGVAKLLVLGIALFVLGAKTATVLYMLSAVGLVIALLQVQLAFSALRQRIGTPRPRQGFGLRLVNVVRLIRQIFSNYAVGLVDIAHRELDMQILAGLTDAARAGSYRVAKNLAMVLMELLNPIVFMLLPEFSSRVAQKNWGEVKRFAGKATRLLGGLALFATVPMYSAVPLLVEAFLPAQIPSIPVFKILLVGVLFSAPLLWGQSLMVATSNSHRFVWASAAGSLIAMAFAFVLVPTFGANGSAFAYGVGLLLTSVLGSGWAIAMVIQSGRKAKHVDA
jgi:O-antigen/teichoic acid export membrane protein